MRRIRVTIARLMGLVVLVAVVLAARRYAEELQASGIFSLAIALNFAALVATVATTGRSRSISAGFAICGWGYLSLTFGPWLRINVGNELITTKVMLWGYEAGLRQIPDPVSYVTIRHSLIGILAGMAGALLAWALTRRPSDPPDRTTMPMVTP